MRTKHSVLVALVAAGCATEPTDTSTLSLDITDTGARGTYTYAGGVAELGITVIEDGTYDLFVDVNGVHMTLIADATGGVQEFDGYTAATGEPTAVTAEDRAVLLELYTALNDYGSDPAHVGVLRRMIGHWAEWPSTLELELQHLFDGARSYSSLCGSCGGFAQFSHDCNHGGWWSDATTAYGWVRYQPAYNAANTGCGYNTAEGTIYSPDGYSYYCLGSEPSGVGYYEYLAGNCFSRCGPGCASDDTQFTQDCGNHDLCVRAGHANASFYCNDQFTSAADDDMSAPHCGTGC